MSSRLVMLKRSAIRARLMVALLAAVLGTMLASVTGAEPTGRSVNATNVPPIRIAIGELAPPTNDPEQKRFYANFAPLLTANLSQVPGFELVERQAIDTVTREISLSLSQTLKPEEAVRIGGLLRADWLVLGSSSKNGETATAIFKIVDARTGIIRDLTTVPLNRTNLASAAATVAEFVSTSAVRVTATEQRVFLGIGGFEDLSINNRYPDFRKNLRAALEQKYQYSRYAVVERAMVNPLLAELRLNLSGLTGSALSGPAAQPAFLLVDGTYQSFQDETAKISLILRVQEIGGAQRLYSLKESPGRELDEKIAAIIGGALQDLRADGSRQTRKEEAVTQLNRGIERARLFSNGNPRSKFFYLGGYFVGSPEESKRVKNVTEASEAFEATLLLDPDGAEAKTYLAICLLDPGMKKVEAARDYLREAIASATNTATVAMAREQLARSFFGEDDKQGLALLFALARDETNAFEHARLLGDTLEPMMAERKRGRVSSDELLRLIDTWLLAGFDSLQCSNEYFQVLIAPANMSSMWYGVFESCGYSKQLAKEHLDNLLPTMANKYPNLAPYIWPSYTLWSAEAGAPVSPILSERFRESMVYAREHPEQMPQLTTFYQFHIPTLLEWSVSHEQYRPAKVIAEIFQHAVDEAASTNLSVYPTSRQMANSAQLYYYAGYTHRGLGQWDRALKYFELGGKKAESVMLEQAGPWGKEQTRVFARDLVEECRQHLSSASLTYLASPRKLASQEPTRFTLGKPVLKAGLPIVFAVDGGKVWLADGLAPFCYDVRSQNLIDLDWPTNIESNVSCICVDDDSVWWGTSGSGLVEMDKRTGHCRVYTEKDGLLLPHITTLALNAGKLWIGFGRKPVGGVGYLELNNRRFTGLSPELDLKTITNRYIPSHASGKEAPRGYVNSLVPRANGDVLVLTENRGVQTYSASTKKWDVLSTLKGKVYDPFWSSPLSEEWCLLADSDVLLVGGNGQASGLAFFQMPEGPVVEPNFSDWLPGLTFGGGGGTVAGRLFLVQSLALDGNQVWVGGLDFLASVNMKTKALERLCALEPGYNREVKGVQVQGDDVWFSIKNELYRISRAQ